MLIDDELVMERRIAGAAQLGVEEGKELEPVGWAGPKGEEGWSLFHQSGSGGSGSGKMAVTPNLLSDESFLRSTRQARQAPRSGRQASTGHSKEQGSSDYV